MCTCICECLSTGSMLCCILYEHKYRYARMFLTSILEIYVMGIFICCIYVCVFLPVLVARKNLGLDHTILLGCQHVYFSDGWLPWPLFFFFWNFGFGGGAKLYSKYPCILDICIVHRQQNA